MNDFESELERGLHDLFDPYLAERPRPWRSAGRGGAPLRLAGGLGGAMIAKLATGAVIAALAAGAGVEAVSTHSLNPVDWGRAVSHQVQSVQPRTATTPAAHSTGSPAARQTPAAPQPKSPVALPSISPPALPTVSPIAVPSVLPPALPTIP